MKNLAIARRYAKALLLIGKEDGRAEDYRTELVELSELIQNESQLASVINNPLYDTVSRKRVLGAIIEKLGLSPVMKSFLLLVFDKGRFNFLPEISNNYQTLADELKGVARAELTSAVKLSNETIEKIRGSLSKMIDKEVKLDVKQDSSLIGGIVTQIGDLVLDGSIKTQLLNMRESLKRGESV
ncbi:MAG: ATP synthase F1 subunit delta [Desulfobacterales bacterium]